MSPPRRTIPLRFALIGSLVIWVVMLAPPVTLISWLADISTRQSLAISLLPAIPLFYGLWLIVQQAGSIWKWPAMQYLGLSAVLLPVVVFCSPLTLWFSKPAIGLVALLIWIALSIAGILASIRIRIKALQYKHPNIDQPVRIAQISDVHAGSRSPAFLRRVVKQVNSTSPDLVLITGDLVDSSAVDAQWLAPLSDLAAPAYLSLGNHERYIDLEAAIDAVQTTGVKTLRNQSITHGCVQIIGIDDADNPDQVALQLPSIAVDESRYRILMYHKPDGWLAACQAGIDLMLAGHTHGGQIWPFRHLVRMQFKHVVGHFSNAAGQSLYVSPGTGTWGPIMRLGTRCEMTVIELTPA